MAKMLDRYHGRGSLEGWILVETEYSTSLYQHAADWGEFMEWGRIQVFTDEQAGPIVAKIYG